MSGPVAGGAERRCLAPHRWHFHHGPIDCIVEADGDRAAVDRAIDRAWARFTGVLAELVAELPLLRTDLASPAGARIAPVGPIAQRMVGACRPHASAGRFVTAMAAVAGSVAEELIGGFDEPGVARASVNNGGDIALRLAPGASVTIGIVPNPTEAGVVAHPAETGVVADSAETGHVVNPVETGGRAVAPVARFRVDAASPVRGIATSGWRGRSFSFGIADSVTVLAPTAAVADVLATLIANAVDVDDPGIVRVAAERLRDDTDLGSRLVTCAVPILPPAAVERALAAGIAEADAQIAAGRAFAVAICLQGRVRTCLPRIGAATLVGSCEPDAARVWAPVPAPVSGAGNLPLHHLPPPALAAPRLSMHFESGS